MYVPPQTLWSTSIVPQGTPAPSAQTFAPGHAAYRILYTRGEELLTPPQYRATFEQSLERAIRGTMNVNDDSLATAYAVSSTAYACTEKNANATAGVELLVRNPAGDTLTNTPLDTFLTLAPRLLHRISSSLDIWGRVYLRKRYNAAGYPTALEWLNPLDIQERTIRGRVVEYHYAPPQRDTENIPVEQIIYLEAFDTRSDGNGLSKFEVAWKSIGIEQGLATYAAAFFVNSARPDGMLTFENELGDDDFEEARKEWQRFKGAGNAYKTAVMPGGAKWTPIQATPTTANTELKAGQREDICAVFGVDPMLVGLKGAADPLSANSTYSAAEVNHLRNVVLPRLRMLILPALNEQWAFRDFNPRKTYTLDLDENSIPALSEANLARSETVITLTGAGILNYNDGRKVLGYAPQDDYILRDPTDVLSLFDHGSATMNQVRSMVGLPTLGINGEVVLISGTLLPVNRLAEVAHKNADGVGQPAFPSLPFGGAPPPAEPPQLPPPAPPAPALPAPEPTPAPEADAAPDVPTVARSAPSLELAVSFASHQFVLQSRRALSGYLTEQGVNAEWVNEDAWRLTLVRADGQTPADAAALIRRVSYDDGRKIDTTASGYFARDGGVYLRVADSDGLAALRTAAALDVGIEGREVGYVGGILLCRVAGDVDLSGAPVEKLPLVCSNVVLYYGDEQRHKWYIRSLLVAQSLELKNWALVTMRNLQRGIAFSVDALKDTDTAQWVRDALLADIEPTEVFDIAGLILRGELVRAYAETRQAFTERLTELIRKGFDNDLDRRNFAAQMRVNLRVTGLQTLRDGLEAGGVKNESFSTDEIAMFRAWLDEQSKRVSDFGAELFKQGITETEVATRADMWTNKALDTLYYQSLALAAPKKPYRWEFDPAKEHCESCRSLHGTVRTLAEWQETVMPKSDQLDCKGFHCGCELVPAEGE